MRMEIMIKDSMSDEKVARHIVEHLKEGRTYDILMSFTSLMSRAEHHQTLPSLITFQLLYTLDVPTLKSYIRAIRLMAFRDQDSLAVYRIQLLLLLSLQPQQDSQD
jgi:hypothetical protein